MSIIEINNLTTNFVDERFLKEAAQKVLEEETKKRAELSIALVGQVRIKALNREYRGKNQVTDVLAFPESKVLFEKFKVSPLQKTSALGEVIICLREVKKNARGYGLTFEKELTRVLIHGILHLLGENHEKSEKMAQKMEEKENHYLNLIFK